MSTAEMDPVTSGRLGDFLYALWPLTTRVVISATTAATPGSPSDGDAYVVPASGVTGQWATDSAEGKIAIYDGGGAAWRYLTAVDQWTVRAQDDDKEYGYDGSVWAEIVGGGSLSVEESGTEKLSAATALNFIGATVTDAGSGQADITIPTGSGARAKLTSAKTGQDYTTATAISWDAADFDDASWWVGGNPTRLTGPTGFSRGNFHTYIKISSATADEWIEVTIRKNGTTIVGGERVEVGATVAKIAVSTGEIAFTATDYFEVLVQTESDTSVDLDIESGFSVAVAGAAPALNGALVKLSSNLTGQNFSTPAAIPFSTESYNTDGWHDNATNNSRLTVPSGVNYARLNASIELNDLTTGQETLVYIAKNGITTTFPLHIFRGHFRDVVQVGWTIDTGWLPVTPGDYFEFFVGSVGDTSCTVNERATYLSVEGRA